MRPLQLGILFNLVNRTLMKFDNKFVKDSDLSTLKVIAVLKLILIDYYFIYLSIKYFIIKFLL